MSKFRRFAPHAAALGVVGGVVALAGALSIGLGLRIVCPTAVWAGNPINGYVTGNEGFTICHGNDNGELQGSPKSGCADPLFFSFQTYEPMSGTVATIHAGDSAGGGDTKSVLVQ